ncbi:hypothetical protein LOTGIDRAFT_229644 [Lottia gigantea]|uniref:Uncharacterized protein n=1 Tax=Lottia gigantea TaxID=225164 RepID=V3ZNW6_LOTGI|nr:hypothetical protein LOTGIDRAFT_229644 [Lottia gigantea]ESO84175.1 hypothetical protein LOTGIDRAFT_229644 [Lottia gigantea]
MANYNGPLYERACSVFQRRVKQVYFQLNPFLERTNLKDEEAECYQPSSKFVIPLSSIVVCEQFDSDEALDWKVLNPEEFWEYLYSDGWADDCSLRVLEGELLELLKTILCVLEKNEEVTSHNTFAYAKNKRRVHRCYVNSQDAKEEFTDQTLLVEFIYYGVNQKMSNEKKKRETLVSWRDYKEMAAKAAGLTRLIDIVDLMESNKKKKKTGDFMSLVRAPKSTYIGAQTENKDVRMETLTAMRWAEGFRAMNNSRRRSQLMQSPPTIGSGSTILPSSDQLSTITIEQNASTISGNGSERLAKMDEILFDKSKKVGRSRRANTFFGGLVGRRVPPGDEFYINQLTPKHTEPFQASEYLRKLKQERMTEREREIEEVKHLTDKMKENKLECIDDSRQSSDGSYKPLMRIYDRRVSFGEFYRFLQDENKYDPRFKKGASKKKKLSDGIKVRRSTSIGIKKSSRATAVVEKPSKKIVTDRQRFANMVGGVTDSDAAKNHCLKNVSSDHKTEGHVITKPPSSVGRGRRQNSMFSDTVPKTSHRRFDEQFYTTLPKITSPIYEGVSRVESIGEKYTPMGNVGERQNRGYRGGYSKRIPTATTGDSDSDVESLDSPVYDEEDDFEDTVFDSNKLNRKYSIEKIKAMKSKKEKKPPVLNILKKFCRVNKMMTNLGPKPSKTPRKSVADANKAKQSAKAFGMFRRLNKKGLPEVKPKTEIGKMKHFEFLKHKDYELKIPDVVKPDFKTSSIENFKDNLLQAMDYFVIRKEMITSSHNYETVTTITFTRPEAYVRLHQVPKDS